jgi:hypothetical protein
VPEGFRVAVPLRSRHGELAVGGWTAWPALPGSHSERWTDIIAAGERFHRALHFVERPSELLDTRVDRWAIADRAAWDERPVGGAVAIPEVARLVGARRNVDAPSQLIHGDLSGNVLFDRLPRP